MKRIVARLALLGLAACASRAHAQALPRIASLFPPGARAGSTVEVAIRGGGMDGAREVVVDGKGLQATLNTADVKVDPAEQKVFTAKCALCHELRGPATISRTAAQWVATVDRMIKDKAAPIEAADRAKIVNYVQAAARASAGLTARVTIAADAEPGPREIRVVGANGTSTAFAFEVTNQAEALETEPNNTVEKPQVVTFPTTINGQIAAGDSDAFAFQAQKGQRLVFDCSAYRLNEASQAFFFPVLYLYDEKGKELAKNTGYFSLDPLIDWTAPADGKYVVMVRDMLYRGSPASVYRLSMGSIPYKTYLFPPGGKRGTSTSVTIAGENMQPETLQVTAPAGTGTTVRPVSTRYGAFRFVAGDYPEYVEGNGKEAPAITLPLSINGRIQKAGEEDRYTFTVTQENLGAYTFDLFADRVNSPMVGRLTLRNSKGVLTTALGNPGARDPRLDYTFTQPGEYTLEVADAGGKSGAEYVYRVSAGPAAPDFQFTVGPDNPNLGPGASVYLGVRVQRRVGITGDIEVTFPKLPAGVSASPLTLAPGETQGFIILTAASDAKPGSYLVTNAVGKTVVNGQTLTRDAVPFEIYRIGNNNQITNRANMVVTVGPEIGWRVVMEPGAMQMGPDSGPVKVTVRLNRNGNESDMPFAIVGVPQGVQGPRAILMKKGTSEFTFTLQPTPAMFAPRGPNQKPPSQFVFALVNGREGEGMQMCSPAVTVRLATTSASAAR